MIARISICETRVWDSGDADATIQDYEIDRKDIIGVVHEDGLVYLYYHATIEEAPSVPEAVEGISEEKMEMWEALSFTTGFSVKELMERCTEVITQPLDAIEAMMQFNKANSK